jgi:hypothetical protein
MSFIVKQMETAVLTTLLVYPKKMQMINLYDYEKAIFDYLVTHNGNAN